MSDIRELFYFSIYMI